MFKLTFFPDESLDEKVGEIEPLPKGDDLRREPYKLPDTFEWCTVDVTNDDHISELYQLLAENYVEDEDCTFRFKYSKEFLLW